jgi:Cu2+-exporting ATPase
MPEEIGTVRRINKYIATSVINLGGKCTGCHSCITAQNGLLIRNRNAFENARNITTVLFDTKGSFEVSDISVYNNTYDEKTIIRLAAAMETQSGHSVARGIVNKVKAMGVSVPVPETFKEVKGKGVYGRVEGSDILIASPGYLKERGFIKPTDGEADSGGTRVFFVIDKKPAGCITLADTIRPESYAAVKALQTRGIKCWMITGDNNATAETVSHKAGALSSAGIILSPEIGALLMPPSTVIVAINARLLRIKKKG